MNLFFPNLLFCCFYLDFGVFVIFEAFGGYDSGKYSPPRSCSVSIWLSGFLFGRTTALPGTKYNKVLNN